MDLGLSFHLLWGAVFFSFLIYGVNYHSWEFVGGHLLGIVFGDIKSPENQVFDILELISKFLENFFHSRAFLAPRSMKEHKHVFIKILHNFDLIVSHNFFKSFAFIIRHRLTSEIGIDLQIFKIV